MARRLPQIKRVTIEDVAREAGVGRQTVSRALRDLPEIAPDTRERVLAAATRLGYRPSALAKGMRTQRSDVIALIVSDIANPFYPAVARGVYDAAEAAGCSVVLYNTDADPDRERDAIEDALARSARGVVGFFYGTPDDVLADYARSVPLVVADRELPSDVAASVSNDFASGTAAAVELLARRPDPCLGMLDSSVGVAVDERRLAFVTACAAHGFGDVSARIVQGPPTIPGGTEATRRLLSAWPEVNGIFAFNDLMGIGAVQAVLARGGAVPRDCAVVGFDDLEMSTYVHPALTTVRIDKYEHGRALIGALLSDAAESTLLPVSLIGRATT
ncbi:LacI family DNA-binding transcriptional regulator [Amycolatopsis sp. A133]|uniref:LacI family DNA-binding transcriptional regulator n=1 Tax=Amycolatopsis sp. A133 TaxID=3064472 RepID=UPI0027FB0F6E|nr:LacI family DNA-binding transcriptional regulator [Amycolatopsis sp. A133]MDQ7806433.1 LacI family DNA-binding transcriptional regulator [Amycolatopsis sp. A133]